MVKAYFLCTACACPWHNCFRPRKRELRRRQARGGSGLARADHEPTGSPGMADHATFTDKPVDPMGSQTATRPINCCQAFQLPNGNGVTPTADAFSFSKLYMSSLRFQRYNTNRGPLVLSSTPVNRPILSRQQLTASHLQLSHGKMMKMSQSGYSSSTLKNIFLNVKRVKKYIFYAHPHIPCFHRKFRKTRIFFVPHVEKTNSDTLI
jgi:hypothetical protein